MAFMITSLIKKQNQLIPAMCVRHRSQRRNLGKPPGIAKTLQERLEEMNFKDPKIHFKVDIGLPAPPKNKKLETAKRIEFIKKMKCNAELEKLARNNELPVSLEEISNEWSKTNAPLHVKKLAEYYGIYEHLFGDAFFTPYIQMDIIYEYENSKSIPVYRGNIIKPAEAMNIPEVKFEAPKQSLWTLMLTNPDGHLQKANSEYIHWLVGNIPSGDVSKGETVFNYLQPFPAKGTGYQRMVFILYQQTNKIDFSHLKSVSEEIDLTKRTFSTLDFYQSKEDVITPAGLAFYQTDWDSSLTKFYHEKLSMPEPVYEYDFPLPFIKPQTWFPIKEPFNLYMDKYRDEKQIAKEFLMRKLRITHPFQKPEPALKYPNAIPFKKGIPSWIKLEIRKERLRWGRINDY